MKNGQFIRQWNFFLITTVLGLFSLALFPGLASDMPPAEMPPYKPAPGEFDDLGKAIATLLQTKDHTSFTKAMVVSADDWRSLITTNLSKDDADHFNAFASRSQYTEQNIEQAIRNVFDQAESLHLDFSHGAWQSEITAPKNIGRIYWSGLNNTAMSAPYLGSLDIVLLPPGHTAGAPEGDFKITLRGLTKFPEGWRIDGGISWTGFPTNVADPKTIRDLALLTKVANNKGFDATDDPALLTLGQTLVHFLRQRDVAEYQRDLLVNSDLIWNMYQKSGRSGPTRKEVDDEVGQRVKEEVENAQATVKLMDDAGIDLSDADIEIQSASVERGFCPGNSESVDNLMANQFKLVLHVKTDKKAKSGSPLAGEYVFAAPSLMRFGDVWKISGETRWEKLPADVVDAKTQASMKFENYIAEHHTLPLHSLAPEIQFTTLHDGKDMKLSDMHGKVVILDFWATWCGPCQEPMADLQKLREGHADWKDKVVIMPLSIDDTIDVVRKHVDKRGWTNTFNVWAGDGGWHSKPAKIFRVTGVPTSYVIDQNGEIVWAGHPATAHFGQTVDELLNE